jgi:hypothetical protein
VSTLRSGARGRFSQESHLQVRAVVGFVRYDAVPVTYRLSHIDVTYRLSHIDVTYRRSHIDGGGASTPERGT